MRRFEACICVDATLAFLGTGLAARFEDEEWSFVVERCLQVDPKRRATMPEICTLLERIAAL